MLDTPPLGVTEIAYFQNEGEFTQVMAGAYAGMTNWYWWRGDGNNYLHTMWYLPGDDITLPGGDHSTWELFSGVSPTDDKVTYYWDKIYEVIQRSNVLIEKADEADRAVFDEAFLNSIKGESLFLRSLSYFQLFVNYGNAPIITKRITTRGEVNTPLSTGIQLLDQVIMDLNEAAELLPASWPDQYRGRATKNAAYGLLVKAHIFRGDFSGDAADYGLAVQAYNKIVGSSLTADYTDNFSAYQENNAESLFEFQSNMIAPDNENNVWLQNDGPWRGVETMATYWGFYKTNSWGWGWTRNSEQWRVTEKMFNAYGTDPRIAYFTEADHGFTKYGKENLDADVPDRPVSLNNVRILRLADVMLLAAEANLLAGNPGAAIDLINDVRARANSWGQSVEIPDNTVTLPEPRSTAETNAATIMQWIEEERAIELLGEEGFRWYDLKRWDARGYKSLEGWAGGDEHFSTDQSASFQFEYPKHLLLPIPNDEIERNSAITGNNPGY
ncbi:MAG: RagB/SusD family nutrient uptake outer membrane protein [Bacteroidetes bacterium]|nr:RagB/SusD family nutrient uptake outer membrane protein [Bacteroidota bacterium]